MSQTEGNESSKIVKWLNQQPCTVARKRHVTVYGVRGDPDIYAVTFGRHFEIETKLPGKTSRPNQVKRQSQWLEAGCPVREVYSLEEAKQFYFEILNSIPERERC